MPFKEFIAQVLSNQCASDAQVVRHFTALINNFRQYRAFFFRPFQAKK
jgi:hypothetical protein